MPLYDDIRANDLNAPFTNSDLKLCSVTSDTLAKKTRKTQNIMKVLKCFTFLSIISATTAIETDGALYQEIFNYHNETALKAQFAYDVVDKIFNAFEQWFFTVTFCDFTYFENRILKYIENRGYGYPVVLLNGCPETNRTRVKPRMTRHGQTAYVVTSNELNLDTNDFAIEAFERTGYFKPRSTVIFIISDPLEIDEYFYYSLKLHFKLLWSRSITNSVLILRAEHLKIYTYNPFIDEVRDLTETENIDEVLIQQYHNLYGTELRLSVFRKIYVSDETGPVLCDSGLAKNVMNFLNASCVPLLPRDSNTVGDLLDNGTATGVTGDLMDGYTDLELSSRILKNSYYGYIDTTYPRRNDELCFLVKNSEKQSTFTTTVKLITLPILVIFFFIVITLILLSMIAYITENKIMYPDRKISSGAIAINLLMCFLKQTVDVKFWGPVFRMLVAMVVLYSLIVNCVLDGIIFSAIRSVRYRAEFNWMSELVNSNLTIGVHNRDKKLFLKSLTSEQFKAFEDRIEILGDQKIKEVIETRQFQYALLLRKSDALVISKKLANLHNGRSLFHIMQDCPVPCSIVYGLRYGSPYLSRINYILDHLNQGGILDQWSETKDYSLQRKVSTTDKENKPLDMITLQEVFYVLLIGLLVSAVVFVLELTLFNYGWRLLKIFRTHCKL